MSKISTIAKPGKKSSSFECLQQKEKLAYISLSALIDILKNNSKPSHPFKHSMDFDAYKRAVLSQTAKLKLDKDKSFSHKNQFNLMYYQHTILSATKDNYRNMAILAAKHNLCEHSLHRLVKQIKKKCIKLSKEVEIAQRKHLKEKTHLVRNKLGHAVVISEVA